MTTFAYHNWGRWVADCADPACPNAEDLERGQAGMVCSFCGQTQPVVWPADPVAIGRVLASRPVPSTRNWNPGETVDMLIAENIKHGVGGVTGGLDDA